jgi:hypothetical protein
MDPVDKATKSKHINTLQYTTVTRIAGATMEKAAYESKAQPASLEKLLLAPGTFSCPIYYFHVSRLISLMVGTKYFFKSSADDPKRSMLTNTLRTKTPVVPGVHVLTGAH